jgi:hypothetical protein
MTENVYAIWNHQAAGGYWYLYELGEADDGFYCRCVDADTWEVMALGLGDTAGEATMLAFRELVVLAHDKAA